MYALAVLFLAIPQSQATAAERNKADLERLQGRWNVVSATFPEEFTKQAHVVIQGDKFVLVSGQQRKELTLVLDATTPVKQVDFYIAGRAAPGIYRLDGDTLQICYEVQSDAPRPAKFTSENPSTIQMTLKRGK